MEILIQNGTVFTGTDEPPRTASLWIQNGRIQSIMPEPIPPTQGSKVWSAKGKWVLPGFIALQSQQDIAFLHDPFRADLLSQGITTLALGTRGISHTLGKSFRASEEAILQLRPGPNLILFLGESTLRLRVFGKNEPKSSGFHFLPRERKEWEATLESALEEGYLGISSSSLGWGLKNPPLGLDLLRSWNRVLLDSVFPFGLNHLIGLLSSNGLLRNSLKTYLLPLAPFPPGHPKYLVDLRESLAYYRTGEWCNQFLGTNIRYPLLSRPPLGDAPLSFLESIYSAELSRTKHNFSMAKAISLLTGELAEWLGISAGRIESGAYADIVLLDPQPETGKLEVQLVIVHGEVVYERGSDIAFSEIRKRSGRILKAVSKSSTATVEIPDEVSEQQGILLAISISR